MRITAAALFITCFAVSALAQSVVIGSQAPLGGIGINTQPPYTLIDLTHPATADGTLTVVSLKWSSHACTSIFKLKFLRPTDEFSLTTFTVVADQGPFNSVLGTNQVFLNPPVTVKKGDLIAITALGGLATCGSPQITPDPSSVVMQVAGDLQSGAFNFKGTYRRGVALLARGTDTAEVREGVIAAVGSLAGNFGSYFRTSLQISGYTTSSGILVFHPAGAPSSATDQALPFTVAGGTSTYIPDIVQMMGKSGLGTLDVISNNGNPPLITARVYNDAGVAGTSGFTEELITAEQMLHPFDYTSILTPSDLTNFRMNIGVRTFGSEVTLNIEYGRGGATTKVFPANTFQQYSLADFSGVSPLANERILITTIGGDVVIYASTTDNRTNDSSVRFAKRD
ncbi:MAG TPA: hypothetical protein VGQ65_20005 [Thermoanaerobaculia bacterium]|nr:hypothetical protein [Thermoanaerobaculia bacterium]